MNTGRMYADDERRCEALAVYTGERCKQKGWEQARAARVRLCSRHMRTFHEMDQLDLHDGRRLVRREVGVVRQAFIVFTGDTP